METQSENPDTVHPLDSLNEIKLDPVRVSFNYQYGLIEQRLEILYKNQEKLLQAIKLLGNAITAESNKKTND
jgi:hypothetical protein